MMKDRARPNRIEWIDEFWCFVEQAKRDFVFSPIVKSQKQQV